MPSRATRQTRDTSTRSRWGVRRRSPARSVPPDKVHKARPNQNPEIGENPTLKVANPCKLVSKSEAQTIIGRTISGEHRGPARPHLHLSVERVQERDHPPGRECQLRPGQPPADQAQPGDVGAHKALLRQPRHADAVRAARGRPGAARDRPVRDRAALRGARAQPPRGVIERSRRSAALALRKIAATAAVHSA